MDKCMMWLMARTPLHVGAGSSVGAIDMPVIRERHTQTPIIPGSGLKGALRDLWNSDLDGEEQERLFGPDAKVKDLKSGILTIGEARTICFPVRSARGAFAWVTSPFALQRLAREMDRNIGISLVEDDSALAGKAVTLADEKVVLEEYCFKASSLSKQVIDLLAEAFPGDSLWETLSDRLVVLSDTLFVHFCANACEVQQRIRIDDETGTVSGQGLFNQENVPSETVLYSVIGQRRGMIAKGFEDGQAIGCLRNRLENNGNIIQVGGDETVGLGYCSVRMDEGGVQ